MHEITRLVANLELEWIKDNQETDHQSSIPILYTTSSGEPLFSPAHGFLWNHQCNSTNQVLQSSQHQSKGPRSVLALSLPLRCPQQLPCLHFPHSSSSCNSTQAQHQPENALEGTWDTSTSYFCFSCMGNKEIGAIVLLLSPVALWEWGWLLG